MKGANELTRQFSKEEMANTHMKKCSAFLAVKQMQVKTALREVWLKSACFALSSNPSTTKTNKQTKKNCIKI
jgi:mannose/cellobiose epimerase-like protein (N-acyl-D-glucosamine 2-epimerase family)